MCNHKNIVVAHGINEINQVYSEVYCRDCKATLYKSDIRDKHSDLACKYIEDNKEKFETLVDLTCDNINKRCRIMLGFNREIGFVNDSLGKE